MDWQMIAVGCIIALVAGMLRRITGFGYAMVTVSLLSLMVEVQQAVAITLLLQALLGLRNLGLMRRRTCWPLLPALGLAGVVAAPIGFAVSARAEGPTLNLMIGACVLSALLPLMMRRGPPSLTPSLGASLASGFAAGFLMSVAAMPAPPLLMYLMRLGTVDIDARRATLMTVFTLLTVGALASRTMAGSIQGSALTLALALAPATLLGDYLGARVPWGLDRALVDLISIAVVGLTASLLIVSSFWA